MRYETRSVLAGSRKGKSPLLTHVYDTKLDRVLCSRVKVENLADQYADDVTAEATCPTCQRRDPRNSQGPNDGPRALKALFQF